MLFLLVGCAGRSPLTDQVASGPDRKISAFGFIEEGSLAILAVNTRVTRIRAKQNYMPVEIGIANVGLPQLRLTRESFILADSHGNRYPLATVQELKESYKYLNPDRQLGDLPAVLYHRFLALNRTRSGFSPTRLSSSIVLDTVTLPKNGYMLDYLYFPRPQNGIREQTFELFMTSPDLPDPVFVKFVIK